MCLQHKFLVTSLTSCNKETYIKFITSHRLKFNYVFLLYFQIAPSSFNALHAQRPTPSKKSGTKAPSASPVAKAPKPLRTAKSPSSTKSQCPTKSQSHTITSATRNLLIQWLQSNGIEFSPAASTEQLKDLVKLYTSRKVYTVDAAMELLGR